jgi:hypothetical protein
MGIVEVTKEEISENLDKRRFEITNLRRVLLNYVGKPLESTVTRMAIPLLYANWEGYVKEVCLLYLEYIERSGTKNRELKAEILGYLWSSSLKPLTGGINFEKKRCIAELALNSMGDVVKFSESERNIDTKSNLNFDILENISAHLCFDVSFLTPYRRHLNALVNLRNNIAHGSFPSTMDYDIFDEHAKSILELMENFENIIIQNLTNRNFCS